MKTKEIRSTGGAARSLLWNQIKADVLQRPILTVHTEETAALGVAMLAGLATNMFSSLKDASNFMVSIKEKRVPLEASREIYDKQYRLYIQLYKSVENLFQQIPS